MAAVASLAAIANTVERRDEFPGTKRESNIPDYCWKTRGKETAAKVPLAIIIDVFLVLFFNDVADNELIENSILRGSRSIVIHASTTTNDDEDHLLMSRY